MRRPDTRRPGLALEARQVLTIAAKEWRERIRNRWMLAVAVVFTAFAFAITYFGAAQEGAVGLRGVDATIASLTSLSIYLVPLITLILGYDAIVAEREQGSLLLLLSLPITRFELLLGKYAGLAATLICATVTGFGIIGAVLGVRFGAAALAQYGGFMLSTVLLGMAFLSLAVLISVLAQNRVAASGIAIACWFVFVLVYDLALLALLVVAGDRLGSDIVPVLLMLNPADAYRMLNLFGFADVARLYGLATVMPKSLAAPAVQAAALVAWILLPLAVASRKFK